MARQTLRPGPGPLTMGDEVAALQAQLAERDAKILEVKEKAKQFVRDKLKSAQEASAATIDVHKTAAEQHKSTAEQHAATIADLATKLASAEAAAEAAPAALGSAIPGELDADSAALISQLRADIREREAKVDEVKEKAKVFVRDKLQSVQQAVKEMEVRHEQFVGALAEVVPPPPAEGAAAPLPETAADGKPSALTQEERALLGAACSLLSKPPPPAPVDTSASDAELSRLGVEVERLEAALSAAQAEAASAKEQQAATAAGATGAEDELRTQLAEMHAKAEEQSATMKELVSRLHPVSLNQTGCLRAPSAAGLRAHFWS